MADAPTRRRCATMEVNEELLRSEPAYREARLRSENRYWQVKQLPFTAPRAGVTVIPVVVHVVFKNNQQNISDDQIYSQIDVLNRDFRGQNADVANVPSGFSDLVADAKIEFQMAQHDPEGNESSGITRTRTTKSSFNHRDDDVKKSARGGADPWPSHTYLNIWVCALEGGLLGYATFPGYPDMNVDGVVIGHNSFGTTGTAAAPFNGGRTATHEVGHWLNLRHIWGDDDGGCNGDDYVTDTPNCAGPNYDKPTYPSITCNNAPHGDLFMNFMDYVDDDTMVMFTRGQVLRMLTSLENDRPTIGRFKPDHAAGIAARVAGVGTSTGSLASAAADRLGDDSRAAAFTRAMSDAHSRLNRYRSVLDTFRNADAAGALSAEEHRCAELLYEEYTARSDEFQRWYVDRMAYPAR